MTKSVFLLDLKESLRAKDHFSADEIVSTALIGSVSGLMDFYNEEKTYNVGDKVPIVTDSGELIILACTGTDVTGEFDATKWEEWNIMDELQGLYDDYFLVSFSPPHLRRNKVWFKINEESLTVAEDIFGPSLGVIIYENFIISERQPIMNKDIVWGKITEKL